MCKGPILSPVFKARVAMEAISGRKSLQKIAADGAERLVEVSQWNPQAMVAGSELFYGGR